jgi:hypothetical protein
MVTLGGEYKEVDDGGDEESWEYTFQQISLKKAVS